LFWCLSLLPLVSAYWVATGEAETQCSVIGIWKPTPGTIPPANAITLFADGTMNGTVTNIFLQGGVCNFTGTYSISRKDAFFVWHAHLVNCVASENEYDVIKQLFCASSGPTYTQSHMNFTAGCFAAFNPSCTQLQWTSFEGFDAGAGGISTWDFVAPAPRTRGKDNDNEVQLNPVCSLKGVEATTIPGALFPVYRYQHTTFNITYQHSTYISRASYDDHLGTSCFVEWQGNYTISPRLEAYPNVELYPYNSVGVQTVRASSGPCAVYTLDPASCTYLSGDSQNRQDCYVVWDGFVDDPHCIFFRLFAHESVSSDASGPTFQVLNGHHHGDEKRGAMIATDPDFDRSSTVLISISTLLELCGVLILLVL